MDITEKRHQWTVIAFWGMAIILIIAATIAAIALVGIGVRLYKLYCWISLTAMLVALTFKGKRRTTFRSSLSR